MDDKLQPHANSALNGANVPNGASARVTSISPRRSQSPKRRKGYFSWSLGVVARLLTWYSIFIILFRCPASLEECDETSHRICKPYFQVKQAVAPHISPYYQTYAAPYVDAARPYYDTLDRKVITPSREQVVKYGGPHLANAKAYAAARWERSVEPHLVEYQALAKVQYDRVISPYVDQATTTLTPYYDLARTSAIHTYYEVLVPAYNFAHPYATRSYGATYDFTKNTVVPSTIWLWNETYVFIDSVVWPHVRDVYVLKVEPQLVRIGERLGRYKEIGIKPIMDETEPTLLRSTFVRPSSSVSATSFPTTKTATRAASYQTIADFLRNSEATPNSQPDSNAAPKSKEEIRELAAKTVAEDLNMWEGKFSQVVKEGASEIEDRVEEISSRMIKNHAQTTGLSLVSQLETTVHIELESLKGAILHILENNQNNSTKRDEKLAAAVRSAGLMIRGKAQKIRSWRQSYEQEIEFAVTKAAEEHFSILERTRDLALQKIGIKWAWMDGITYKDWQRYHQLKDRFEEWTEDLKRSITTHPGLVRAQLAGSDIEDKGMDIAHKAALELGRLKQVASWKAIAEDFTDDFDSATVQLAAEAAKERRALAAESARSVGEEATTTAAATAESEESSVVAEHDDTANAQETQSGEPLDDAFASLQMDEQTAQPTGTQPDQTVSVAEPTESPTDPTSTDAPEQTAEEILESSTSVDDDAASATVKSALFGAAAEDVPTEEPIMDDEVVSSTSTSSEDQSSSSTSTSSTSDTTADSATPSPESSVTSKSPEYTESVRSHISSLLASYSSSFSAASSTGSATAASIASEVSEAEASETVAPTTDNTTNETHDEL